MILQGCCFELLCQQVVLGERRGRGFVVAHQAAAPTLINKSTRGGEVSFRLDCQIAGHSVYAMDYPKIIKSSSKLGCNCLVAARCGKIMLQLFLLFPFPWLIGLSARQASPMPANHLNNLMSLFVMLTD